MKPILFMPPAAALLLAGVWGGTQRHNVTKLESETARLREIITTARESAHASAESAGSREKPTAEKDGIDWKDIAAELEGMESGQIGSMRTLMRLQQRLLDMSEEQILASLDELAALDLTDTQRRFLENLIISSLIERNPSMVLTRFTDRLHDSESGLSWQLSRALGKWADQDASAAIAWMEKQISGGTFDSKSLDGKSNTRTAFEAALVASLLKSDPESAKQRVAALPEDQRKDILMRSDVTPENAKLHAELIRASLSDASEVTDALAQAASRLAHQGYENVTKFLDEAGASSDERAVAVEKAAEGQIRSLSWRKKISHDDLDAMRTWAEAESPGSQDRLTGKALATATQNERRNHFTETAALALEYHEKSGNDEVLAAFLDGVAARSNNNKEESRTLAENIADPELRAKILEKLK